MAVAVHRLCGKQPASALLNCAAPSSMHLPTTRHPTPQEVPPSESPLPAFARWVAAQQVAGALEFEVKGDEGAALWTAEAARAAKEGGLEAAPAMPSAAEEEAACVAAGGR